MEARTPRGRSIGWRRAIVFGSILCLVVAAPTPSRGQSTSGPQWIWTPEQKQGQVPQESCYFRKTFVLSSKYRGRLEIAADDVYVAYLNGKKVGVGSAQDKLQEYDITPFLRKGKNLLAVQVTNRNGDTAGLAAQLILESDEGPKRQLVTNPTWKTNTDVLPLWNTSGYRDSRWLAAQVWRPFGVEPASQTKSQTVTEVTPFSQLAAKSEKQSRARDSDAEQPRFRVPVGFEIQHVVGGKETGSLIAMAFNEFGQILVSREDGPLLLVYDSNENQIPDAVRTCCDKVKSCHGILPVNGHVFVVGTGPDGRGLYRLEDRDRDGTFEFVKSLVTFEPGPEEFGPHGLAFGPDGLIYLAVGCYTKPSRAYASSGPYRNPYEGDLVPRYEDPRGHAAGIRAPGGCVLRVDTEGERVEVFAGGLHNPYDLAFNSQGELFLHDGDLPGDAGTPWERPARLLHVVPGGDFGWRSGWSKWPEDWIDTLPGIHSTKQAAYTGCVFYEHSVYPRRYQGVLFAGNWAQGNLEVIRVSNHGAGFRAEVETFLEGRPLNITDLDVGPDGAVYFTTGGRGTEGNVYRVVYTQPETTDLGGPGILPAVRQPQLHSAWGRQEISTKRRDLGGQWDFEIRAFVRDNSQPPVARARALHMMHLVGPPPSEADLRDLLQDSEPEVRAAAAQLLGLIRSNYTAELLRASLKDEHPLVRRRVCESLVRCGGSANFAQLETSLGAPDRFESWAARRLLETTPISAWRETFLNVSEPIVFAQAAVAAMIASPERDLAIQTIDRAITLSEQGISEDTLVQILRVIGLCIERGRLQPQDLPVVGTWLSNRYPSANERLNRELTRLLVALRVADALPKLVEQLNTYSPQSARLFLGFQLRFMDQGWTPAQKADLLAFYETASQFPGGVNLPRYLERVSNEFLAGFSAAERQAILDRGEKMPHMALGTLFLLPESEDVQNVASLIALDRKLPRSQAYPIRDLRIGILAILARSQTEMGMAYLREVYESDPERRAAAAMGLAQAPDGRNWDYLVRGIPFLDDEPAKEVLTKLREVNAAPEDVEHYREVILCGLRLGNNGGMLAAELLKHWVGSEPEGAGEDWRSKLLAWQRWFQRAHPNRPAATPTRETGHNTWTQEDLETFLSSDQGQKGNPERGQVIFQQATCVKCHQVGKTGEQYAPSLTNVSRRLQVREILEAILFPSQKFANHYRAYQFEKYDGTKITGQVIPEADERFTVIPSDGRPVTLSESEIKLIHPTNQSPMPEGLLNALSLEEIADLLAFLNQPVDPEVAQRPE